MRLPVRLTLSEAAATLSRLQEAIAGVDGVAEVELDASALEEFDTSAIAVLLEAHRAASERGLAFRLAGAPPKLGQLAQLYGVRELIGAPQEAAGSS